MIIIPGNPIPQARHRSILHNGIVWQWDPQKKQKHEVSSIMRNQKIEQEYSFSDSDSFHVDLNFAMKRPSSRSVELKCLTQWYGSHHSKCDLDNLEKFVLDCGNKILWSDDSRITRLTAQKFFSQNPRTEIKITVIKEIQMANDIEKFYKVFTPNDFENIKKDMFAISLLVSEVNEQGIEMASPEKLAATASDMIAFAEKWADKLRKIKTK